MNSLKRIEIALDERERVYIICNNRFVEEALVLRQSGGLYTLKFTQKDGGLRLKSNRIFKSRAEAERMLKENEENKTSQYPYFR